MNIVLFEDIRSQIDQDKEDQRSKSRAKLSEDSAPKETSTETANSGHRNFAVREQSSITDPRENLGENIK